MRKLQKGFTLIEIMMVVAVIALIGAVVVGISCRSAVSSKGEAERSAKAWAAQLGGEVTGVNCTRNDTDGDGYVSCTIFRKDKDPISVDCAARFTMNDGCRLSKTRIGM